MFYIQQTHENGCGFACLKMMLANIRNDKRFLFLPEKEKNPLTYKDLIAVAKQQGLNLCGFKVESKEEVSKHKTFPMILRISPQEGVFHAVLVTKIKNGSVYYLDPLEGKQIMKLYKFCKVWDGTGLMIEEDNGGPFPYKISEPNQTKNFVVSAIIQIISGVFCVLGIYFVNKNINIVFPVTFLSAFIVTELILKIYLFKDMKRKDEFYTNDLNIKVSSFRTFFERLEKFKTLSVVNPVSFATNMVVCMFVILVSILNSLNNLILVLIPISLSLVDLFFYEPWKKNKDREIQINEAKINTLEDVNSFKLELAKIHEKAYSLGGVEISKRYIYIFINILCSILVATISKDFSITSIVFCLFIQIVLYDYLTKVFSFSLKKKELDVSKAKLINTIHQDDEISSN